MAYDATEGSAPYKRYMAEIECYEREFRPWIDRSKKIVKLYKDEDNAKGTKKRFNILWSNVETLRPALYARNPEPVAERRFKDADPVGRVSSEVLERCVTYVLDDAKYKRVMKRIIKDRLLPGRGVMWHRYVPQFDGDDELESESIATDYVYYEDFGHNVCRTWEEVTLVWRKVYLTREKLVERFGEELGNKIELDYSPKDLKQGSGDYLKRACVYELWDSERDVVVFLSKSHQDVLSEDADPLNLRAKFPCQQPLYSTTFNDSLIPVPDYALYQTQARELERLTARIDSLQKALKLVGVYDSSAPELGRILNEGYENKLVPIDQWAGFAEKGGIKGAIDFIPIKEVAEVLIGLYEAREQAKNDLYEITGIADIIRGNSEPAETATAQQIKGQFAVLRISDSQADVQDFVRDSVEIIAEIVAEHFSLETIKAMSGVNLMHQEQKAQIKQQAMVAQQQGQPPPEPPEELVELLSQPTWEEVHALLKNDVLRQFRIDIETDSTIRMDEDAERQARVEFLTAAGGFLEKATAAAQQTPALGPLMAEMLMFGIRAFRRARQLEPAFEDAMRKLQVPQEPPPNPELLKIQAEQESREKDRQAEIQVEQAKQQAQNEQETQRQMIEDQRAERDAERTERIERYKADLEIEVERERIAMEREVRLEEARLTAESQRVNGARPN